MRRQDRGRDDELCDILMRTGCLKFGTFKLANGTLSSYYIDLRSIQSDPVALKRVIFFYSSILETSELKQVRRIAGVPTVGIAFGSILAFNLAKPFIYVRKATKEPARGRRVEGILLPGDKVVVIDDVITTGKNIMEAADAIRSEGGLVEDAVVLIDRQQRGMANLAKIDVRLHSFSTMQAIAGTLLRKGSIDDEQHREIVSQVLR